LRWGHVHLEGRATEIPRSRRTSRYGGRCVRRVIPRRDAQGERLRNPVDASMPCGHSASNRLQIGWPPGLRERSRDWCSQQQWAVRWIQRTSAVTCVARSSWCPAWSRDWTPRVLRHSFVSLLSDAGVPVEMISQLVGHRGTSVTEVVYRHQIRPVIQTGATVMDKLFGQAGDAR
jgi:integrase